MKRQPILFFAMALALAVPASSSYAALSPGYVEIDNIHADIAMPYVNGAWETFVHSGNTNFAGNYAPDLALLMVNASTQTTRQANGSNNFDFMGVAAGDPIWRISSTQVPGQLYLGIEAQYGFSSGQMATSNTTNYKSWDPDGSGPASNSRYVMLNVVDVRGPGYFSIYDFGTFGTANVRVDSADGLDVYDGLPQLVNSHSHYNWVFSQPGFYEVDFQAHTFLGPNSGPGTEVVSPVTTFHFQVVPEPGTATLGLLGALALGLRRIRRNPSVTANFQAQGKDR
jgi:surface-anchored protein